jgi:hypothetical protein
MYCRTSSKVDQIAGIRERGAVLDLEIGRVVLPVKSDAVGAVGAVERALQALLVVHVGRDDLGASIGKRAGLCARRVARQRPHRVRAVLVLENGLHEAAGLRAGRAGNGDDLLV